MIIITVSGRLAHQPELRMGARTSVCEFRLLSSRFAKGEEHTEAVTFFCFGDDAERFCENTEKGQLIEASGSQETSRWTDQSGEHVAVKYKLAWWNAGPRSSRSRQAGEGGERRSSYGAGSAAKARPPAPSRQPARQHPQEDGGERGNRVPLI